MRTIAVIGASLAGLSAARGLRAAGFEGRVVIVGDETHAPYDRPPLSKGFLAGTESLQDISLTVPDDEGLALEWRLGERATRLDPAGARVHLASGGHVACDGVVLATGARVRTLPGERLPGVHELRTLDDALVLKAALVPGARLVLVGAGFIGAEIASTARGLGLDVTVVEAAPTPLALALGEEMGAVCAAMHGAHGVHLTTGVGVEELLGDTHVRGLRLADGTEVPADLVVVGIGTVPNTEWLDGAGLVGAGGVTDDLRGGVLTDAAGRTNLPNVVATGDVSAAHCPFAERVVRHEHWTSAARHPAVAAAALLGAPLPRQPATAAVPYAWSDQYGVNLQFAGHHREGDVVEVVEGDPAQGAFAATYRREGRLVAAFAADQPRLFTKLRRELSAGVVAPV